jgi:hypothetical protein
MSEAVVWGGRTDTTTATKKYHSINIEGERKKEAEEETGDRRAKSEMRVLAGRPEGEGSQARTGPCGRVRGVVVCGPVERS